MLISTCSPFGYSKFIAQRFTAFFFFKSEQCCKSMDGNSNMSNLCCNPEWVIPRSPNVKYMVLGGGVGKAHGMILKNYIFFFLGK